MAKEEQGVAQTPQGTEETTGVSTLTRHLEQMVKDRCRVKVDAGNGQHLTVLLAGEVKDVRIKPVWAYFTVGDTGFRTTTTADKEALLRGETGVSMTKVFTAPEARPSETRPIETKPKMLGFIPRSRRSLIGASIAVATRD